MSKQKFITEEEKLKLHLSRSYEERFRNLIALIRLGKKLKAAKITSQPAGDGLPG
ncbi:MAG: hypothetical protein JNK73_08140 [Bacteroidia bacterium]|nr:hypothetical protein [Bacteroidia bacterium]